MKKLFGTDGVRGVANKELTPELAFRLGKAGAYVLTKNNTGVAKVLVGKDGRRSGDMLEAALTAGLCAIGVNVYQCGVIPTPAVAHLIKQYGCDAGVMISASHNPMEDNGIKFFNSLGLKLPDETEAEIEKIMATDMSELPCPIGGGVGVVATCSQAIDHYAGFITSTVPNINLNGIRIALDCANGATSKVAPLVFQALGAEVLTIHNTPDGCNINANCGSTHMESLREFVKANNVHIGLAFDGDGDRLLAVDHNGNDVDGDVIMAICGQDMRARGELVGDTIVATVMSNQGLEVFCQNNGINLHRTAVGDRYVLEKMLDGGFTLGGEQSGHLIFSKYNSTGDAILAGVQLLSVLLRHNKSLAELAGGVEIFPQVLINVRVPAARMADFATCPKIADAKAKVEANCTPDERLLLRTSGTEPLVRVMMEGRDAARINEMAAGLAEVIKDSLV